MAKKGKKGSSSTKRTVKTETANRKAIKFVLSAPEARHVCLSGDFNNWDIRALPMKRNKENQWEVSIQLDPGRYEYKYLVDGTWFDNVPGVEKAHNSLGTQNCVINVK